MQPRRRLAYTPLLATDRYRFSDDQPAVKFSRAADTTVPPEASHDIALVLLTAHLRPGHQAVSQPI